MLDDLPLDDAERAALVAIRDAVAGWSWTNPPVGRARETWRAELRRDHVTPTDAERWLDHGLNGEAAQVAGLVALGLAETWDLPDGSRAATLSGLAAQALEVELALTGYRQLLPRWVRPGELPKYQRSNGEHGHSQLDLPELIIDGSPGPGDEVEPVEVLRRTSDGIVFETVMLFGLEIPVDRRMRGKGAPRVDPVPKRPRGRPRKLPTAIE